MKLDAPLINLISRCCVICEPECCGVDGYDFSPIHIASYLIMYRAEVDGNEVANLKNKLQTLKVNYGSSGASSNGVTIEEMNQRFSGQEIDSLVDEISANIDVAIGLIPNADDKRYRNT